MYLNVMHTGASYAPEVC